MFLDFSTIFFFSVDVRLPNVDFHYQPPNSLT